MSRWSTCYQASITCRDTLDAADIVDFVDIQHPSSALAAHSVNSVDIVTASARPDIDADNPAEAAYVAEERAAIIAEAQDDPWAAVPHELPPSWPASECEPSAGARCSCCRGKRWWSEAMAPRGWRCRSCHPPAGHKWSS